MDFRQLRYFLAVAEHESFRRAAEAVNVAQSALSKHIAEMERQLGLRLFERLSSGVRLTQAGRVYAEEAHRAVETMERARTRARMAARGEIDLLCIGLNDIAARNRDLARGIGAFAAAFPEVQLEFQPMISDAQLAALRFGKIDAAVMIERPEDPAFAHVRLAADPFCLALPANHPLAQLEEVPVAALVEERFVSVAVRTYWLPQTRLLARCRALGLAPRVVQEVGTDQLQMNLVAAGVGIGFVNASIGSMLGPDVVLRPVEGLDVVLHLDLVWRQGASSAALTNFVGEISRQAGVTPG